MPLCLNRWGKHQNKQQNTWQAAAIGIKIDCVPVPTSADEGGGGGGRWGGRRMEQTLQTPTAHSSCCLVLPSPVLISGAPSPDSRGNVWSCGPSRFCKLTRIPHGTEKQAANLRTKDSSSIKLWLILQTQVSVTPQWSPLSNAITNFSLTWFLKEILKTPTGDLGSVDMLCKCRIGF